MSQVHLSSQILKTANTPFIPVPPLLQKQQNIYKNQGTWERVSVNNLMKQTCWERKDNWTKTGKDDVFLRVMNSLFNKTGVIWMEGAWSLDLSKEEVKEL